MESVRNTSRTRVSRPSIAFLVNGVSDYDHMGRVYAHEQLHSVRLHHINSTNNIMYYSVGEYQERKYRFTFCRKTILYKMVLLGLLDLPDSIKKSLLSFEDTPDYVKAKLGNREIEKELIGKFNKLVYDTLNAFDDNKIHQLKKFSYQLIYINSTLTNKNYLNALQSNVVHYYAYEVDQKIDNCDSCPKQIRYEWSLASSLIYRLSQLYPYRLTSGRLSSYYKKSDRPTDNGVRDYFKDVEKLLEKLFGQQIEIKAKMIANGKQRIPKDLEY